MPVISQEARAKALAARKAAVANNPYRVDWLEAEYWTLLASELGIRLPQWHIAPTARKLKQWHESLEKAPFEEVYGCKPARLIALNPSMPLRAFVGQMLERQDFSFRR